MGKILTNDDLQFVVKKEMKRLFRCCFHIHRICKNTLLTTRLVIANSLRVSIRATKISARERRRGAVDT